MMKSSDELARGRGITGSVLTRWTFGMIHLYNICEEVEKYCNITSVTSEQYVDMRPSLIARDNEDVEKFMQWFSKHIPFLINDVRFKRNDKVIKLSSVNNNAKIGKEKNIVDKLTLFHRICVAKQSDEELKMFFTLNCYLSLCHCLVKRECERELNRPCSQRSHQSKLMLSKEK
ncbi:hypothetical protein AVEN_132223-1 [Araneus ventricosus]|uniref:Uncharacterized protein n=1 Tax=Araneus ventricosus TaxID=182803 RepID=A0A4Y2ILJ6_ARAVE|nr:hypothetical protein AVEN_132223-1 [Araneus ventricosus]